MPFAGFPDFDACLQEQADRGHDEESARRICGSLQAETEKHCGCSNIGHAIAYARDAIALIRKGDLSVGDLAAHGGLKQPQQAGVRGAPPAPQLAGNTRRSPARKIPRGLMRPGTKVPMPTEPVKPMKNKEGARLHIDTLTRAVAPGIARARNVLAAIKPTANMAKVGKAEAPPPEPDEATAPSDEAPEKKPSGAEPYQTNYQGIPLYIDRPKGFIQRGKNEATGEEWQREYKCDYGYIPGTAGGDGEGLDVFLGGKKDIPEAHWIVQRKKDKTFDEYKLMLGFKSREEAKSTYLDHVPRKYFGSIVTMSVEMVKALLGIEPVEQLVGKAFIYAVKGAARAQGPTFAEHARSWVKARGLLDEGGEYGGELGRAIIRMANVFSREGHNGMSALLARAHFNFLCDAWDGMHTMILNDADFQQARATLEKAMTSLANDMATIFAPAVVNAPHAPIAPIEEFNANKPDGGLTDQERFSANPGTPTQPKQPTSALDGGQPADRDPRAPGALDDVGKALMKLEITPEACERLAELIRSQGAPRAPVTTGSVVAKRMPAFLQNRIVEVKKEEGGELRYLLGIVLEPDVVDAQDDTYTADEIRKTEWLFMEQFRNVGLQHKALINGMVNIVESYIAPVDMTVAGTVIKAGTWMMGLHVIDDEIWAKVKRGELTGLSIAGFARREPL